MVITFGKLSGSVRDGSKSIDVVVDGAVCGMVEVWFEGVDLLDSRRCRHVATEVSGYILGAGIDVEVAAVPVGGKPLAGVVADVKAALIAAAHRSA